jgi:tellurite resistance protein
MFHRFFGSNDSTTAGPASAAPTPPDAATAVGDTATVRRIVAKLESMPPDEARFIASAAYTLARAANADLEISDEETTAIETALQSEGSMDEATAVLVTEMAKLQAKTVVATEDYVVVREFRKLASEAQRIEVLRACFAISAANGTISAEEASEVNEIARELDLEPAQVNAIRADFHDQLSAVQEVRRVAAAGNDA